MNDKWWNQEDKKETKVVANALGQMIAVSLLLIGLIAIVWKIALK